MVAGGDDALLADLVTNLDHRVRPGVADVEKDQIIRARIEKNLHPPDRSPGRITAPRPRRAAPWGRHPARPGPPGPGTPPPAGRCRRSARPRSGGRSSSRPPPPAPSRTTA